MATNTYVALDKVTLGSATSSVTFSSISQGYTDLIIVFSGLSTWTSDNGPRMYMNFNSDFGSNYSVTTLRGNGSSATSTREANNTYCFPGRPNPSFGGNTSPSNMIIHLMNYSSTAVYKTILSRYNNNANGDNVGSNVNLWRSTSAITSIAFDTDGDFAAGSTFSLYGIAASSVGAKATGGIISSDDLYYYHTFTSTGTFTPLQSLTCDFLVLAGGGGGVGGGGGAGGAGGYRTSVGTSGRNSSAESALSLTATGYTVTIGAGGAGGIGGNDARNGSTGSNSVFSTITSNGGGYGAAYQSGGNGGSGGSGGGGYSASSTPGSGTAGQGFDATQVTRSAGAGVGGTNSNYNGGAGITSPITGTALGGGGASAGDQSGQPTGTAVAGGGAAATAYTTNNAGNGTANTGGGGGGASGQSGVAYGGNGGAGGSGLVIVRYAK